ncbi:MAG TPA: flavodoxin family protein [Armatimonadetes bacterium]|nr:flavodoxin family protein [Armatimonadota bacterium]
MMRVIVLHTSPNDDGLTASLAEAAVAGANAAGAEAEMVKLTALDIPSCRQCNNGWGMCRTEGRCGYSDDFNPLREKLWAADAWVLVTPVYFGEPSEIAKSFMDRLRRCNVGAKGEGLAEKPVIGVAAAGGSGRGTATCLLALDRFYGHINAQVADLITVTRRSAEYKREAVRAAAQAMVEAMQA